jgi:hypothetical protein
VVVSAFSSQKEESARPASVRAEVINARAEWLRWRLIRQRRRCAETLASTIKAFPVAAPRIARGRLDLGDLEELEDVAPTLRLVDD